MPVPRVRSRLVRGFAPERCRSCRRDDALMASVQRAGAEWCECPGWGVEMTLEPRLKDGVGFAGKQAPEVRSGQREWRV